VADQLANHHFVRAMADRLANHWLVPRDG